MQIIHKIDDFLFLIFPEITREEKNHKLLISKLEEYYTYGPYKPKVTIKDDSIIIDIDTSTILAQDSDYKKVIALCEKNKFVDAQKILEVLIQKNPTNSEYHRIMGQIYSEIGEPDEAINSLIDSLRWDAKNGWALLMMGNVFTRSKNDIQTALKYYDQSLKVNPNDHIVVNNMGANLMQLGKLKEAKKYLWEAIRINKDYPNTHSALGLIALQENDLHSAFYSFIKAAKLSKPEDRIYQTAIEQAFAISKNLISNNQELKVVKEYLHKLEFECDREIILLEDANIPTAAKIEFAEIHNREKHNLRYKPNYPAVQHLIMHELVHLELVIEARKVNLNQLFISTPEQKKNFLQSINSTIENLKKEGFSESDISSYCNGLFEGLNRQIYNTPIDLFIEDLIFTEYSELRPHQFISLHKLIQEGIQAVNNKRVKEISPKDILSKSKIYNIVSALQFKDFFGIDLIEEFNATNQEKEQAKKFYTEYLKYKTDRKPAEEYQLVLHWAQDLKLDEYFTLVSEIKFKSDKENNSSLDTPDPYQEIEMFKFQRSQEQIGTNMAVVMYMVGALEFFDGMPKEEIKKIAFEIAMQGTKGFHPEKKDYILQSIPNKIFTGYQILAYYYISWKLAIPEMLNQLQLPYKDEYNVAIKMFNK